MTEGLAELSIADMLTRLQRQHLENLIKLSEAEDGPPSAQVLAQINRYLADNGITLAPSEVPKVIEGNKQPTRPALPNYAGHNYNE